MTHRHTVTTLLVSTFAVAALVAVLCVTACSGGANGGGGGGPVTVAGKTGVLTLGEAGIVNAFSNTPVTTSVGITPFDQPPSDAPVAGALRLRSEAIRVGPPDVAKRVGTPLAPLAGAEPTGTVRVSVEFDGEPAGTYVVTVVEGEVTSVMPPVLLLPRSVLTQILDNFFTVGMEVLTDFAGRVEVLELDMEFGMTEDDPDAPTQRRACCFAINGPQQCLDIGFVDALRSAEDCSSNLSGVAQEFGTNCASFSCGESFEACCFADGVCDDLLPSQCEGQGVSRGTGTDCDSVECTPTIPLPDTEACCGLPESVLPEGGTCLDATLSDCLEFSGNPRGEGTRCATTDCADVPTRACCFNDDTCDDLPSNVCAQLGGTARAEGTNCATESCAEPAGVCCMPGGDCLTDVAATCEEMGGELHQGVTSCDLVICDSPPWRVMVVSNFQSRGHFAIVREDQVDDPPGLMSLSCAGPTNDPVIWAPESSALFATAEDAALSLCPRIVSFFTPPLAPGCRRMMIDSDNWPEDQAGYDPIIRDVCDRGACCTNGSCQGPISPTECSGMSGSYQGVNITCESDTCAP